MHLLHFILQQLELIQYLYAWCSEEQRQNMIGSYEVVDAARNGQLEVFQQLQTWCIDKERQSMFKSNNYRASKVAAKGGHPDIVKQLDSSSESPKS